MLAPDPKGGMEGGSAPLTKSVSSPGRLRARRASMNDADALDGLVATVNRNSPCTSAKASPHSESGIV